MKCPDYLKCEYDLDGLPDGSIVHWNNLHPDIHSMENDEDTIWIELPNGLGLDVGCYGWNSEPPYKNFRIDIVFTNWGWDSVERSICLTPEETAKDVVRLANKWNNEDLLRVARNIAHRKLKKRLRK